MKGCLGSRQILFLPFGFASTIRIIHVGNVNGSSLVTLADEIYGTG
jgi:hypothetical protein